MQRSPLASPVAFLLHVNLGCIFIHFLFFLFSTVQCPTAGQRPLLTCTTHGLGQCPASPSKTPSDPAISTSVCLVETVWAHLSDSMGQMYPTHFYFSWQSFLERLCVSSSLLWYSGFYPSPLHWTPISLWQTMSFNYWFIF